MNLLYHLLRDGYFPKELPPAFNTILFSKLMDSNKDSLPLDFRNRKLIAKETAHNIPHKGLRRKLSI